MIFRAQRSVLRATGLVALTVMLSVVPAHAQRCTHQSGQSGTQLRLSGLQTSPYASALQQYALQQSALQQYALQRYALQAQFNALQRNLALAQLNGTQPGLPLGQVNGAQQNLPLAQPNGTQVNGVAFDATSSEEKSCLDLLKGRRAQLNRKL